MSLSDELQNKLNSRALLFCGAGFSAACLNFENKDLSVAAPLLSAMNSHLDYEYSELQIAADEFIEQKGEHSLFEFLKGRYTVNRIDENMSEILRYPWARIYTTNYDSAIEGALTKGKRPHYSVDRSEPPSVLNRDGLPHLKVVHLHGSSEKWTYENFSQSCVIGAESYFRAAKDGRWAARLREDLAEATIVLFVGFSNSDFYISQEINSVSALKEKAFFINYEGAISDRELHAKQKKYGKVLNIGIRGLAEIVSEIDLSYVPARPVLSSFEYFKLSRLAGGAPSLAAKSDLFVRGVWQPEHVASDHLNGTNEYRAKRTVIDEIIEKDAEQYVALIRGGISCGKSQVLDELSYAFASAGRTVLRLRRAFYDSTEEIDLLFDLIENPVVVVDNISRAPEILESLLTKARSFNATIVLSSRSIAAENLQLLSDIERYGLVFDSFDVEKLDDFECRRLIGTMNNVCRWPKTVTGHRSKVSFLQRDCSSRMANVLLYFFESTSVREKILVEIEKFESRDSGARELVILALVLTSMGLQAKLENLSELIGRDAGSLANKIGKRSDLVAVAAGGDAVDVFPGITAREIIRSVLGDAEVSKTVSAAVRRIAPDAFYSRELRSLAVSIARHFNLSKIIESTDEIESFYDDVSLEPFFSTDPNFWLQISIRFRLKGDFDESWHYLLRAFDEVDAMRTRGRQFDPYQIRDQECKLLLTDPAKVSVDSVQKCVPFMISQLKKGTYTAHIFSTIELVEAFCDRFVAIESDRNRLLALREISKLGSVFQAIVERVPMFLARDVKNAGIALNSAMEVLRPN